MAKASSALTESTQFARSPRTIALAAGMMSWFSPFTTDTYTPGLPQIAIELGSSVTLTQLTLTAALYGLLTGQVVTGILSDRIGRRIPLLSGLSLYTLASLVCMLAPSMPFLIVARFVQGLAGGAAMATSRSVGRDLFEGRALSSFYSMNAAIASLAPVIGPLMAGALLAATGTWRSIFLMIAILGLGGLVIAILFLPETLPRSIRERHSDESVVDIVASPALGLGFADVDVPSADHTSRRTRRRAASGNRARRGGNVGNVLRKPATLVAASVLPFVAGVIITLVGGGSFLLQNDYGMSPSGYSFVFAAGAACLVACNLLNRRLTARWHPASVATVGVAVTLLAAVGLTLAVALNASIAFVIAALMAPMVIYGLIYPNVVTIGMAVNGRHAGTASAVLGVAQISLGALTSPLIGVEVPGPIPMMCYMFIGYSMIALILLLATRRMLRRHVVWAAET